MKHKTKRIYYFKIQGVPCAYVTFFEGGSRVTPLFQWRVKWPPFADELSR